MKLFTFTYIYYLDSMKFEDTYSTYSDRVDNAIGKARELLKTKHGVNLIWFTDIK